jgi:hypothetical protein
LKGILDAEREATLPGKSGRAALTVENYDFRPGVAEGALLALHVTPRRRDAALLDGTIFVTIPGGDLVRVEGRLAKSPSFWTRTVDLVRHYEPRGGTPMLVAVRSLADVKIVGPTEFLMSYEYASVNGQATNEVSPTLAARLGLAPTPRR